MRELEIGAPQHLLAITAIGRQAGHGNIHGPGHQAVLADTGGDLLVHHYYANNGTSLLGINRLAHDSAGRPRIL